MINGTKEDLQGIRSGRNFEGAHKNSNKFKLTKSGPAKTRQLGSNQVRSGQVASGLDKSSQVRSDQEITSKGIRCSMKNFERIHKRNGQI